MTDLATSEKGNISASSAASSAQEIRFDPSSVLSSVTDFRGVIRYANPAFCAISGYSGQELVGAPHKVIRHPDMPRGVFHLFWERLNAGLPVCAYVKNSTIDGNFYHVLAIVTGIDDGFLSVRIKPQADLLKTIHEIYNDLLFDEAHSLTPEDSAKRLLSCLADLGFDTYDAFMSATLRAEIALREDYQDTSGTALNCISDLSTMITRAETLVDDIAGIFGQVRGEPVNLRILAGRMEEAGAAIATISKNYETMAADTYHMVTRLNDQDSGILPRMRAAIDRGRLAAQLATIMRLAAQAAAEDEIANRTLLTKQAERLEKAAKAPLAEIVAIGRTFPDISRQLRRRINGLDLVKLLCRVESGRIGDTESGLNGIINRLEDAHQCTDRHLSELSTLSTQINSRCRGL